ncbi:NAD(P)-binding protein [Aspergillus venezuelensis]
MKVAIVGATGETGRSVVSGLLNAEDDFEITALIRPSSLPKRAVQDLKSRGVKVLPVDLKEISHNVLVGNLHGTDVVISTIHYQSLSDEIILANAAKDARVSRYVPCFWATVAARGVMALRDAKEDILDHVQRLRLPYTAIDVGWWYQISLPPIPSGKFDYALMALQSTYSIFGDENTPSVMTDLRDIGLYVAKIIGDERTINKRVLAATEMRTQNEVVEIVERVTGEEVDVMTVPAADISAKVEELRASNLELDQERATYEYFNSWGVRGDNTVENARYLGYLIFEDFYPGVKGRGFEEFVREALDGKVQKVYGA